MMIEDKMLANYSVFWGNDAVVLIFVCCRVVSSSM